MRRVRFAGSNGDFQFTIPSGSDLTYLRVIPGYNEETGLWGTWLSINESAPHLLICPIDIRAADFGFCCGVDPCNRFPGADQGMTITVGTQAAPRTEDDTRVPTGVGDGSPPQEVFLIYQGGP